MTTRAPVQAKQQQKGNHTAQSARPRCTKAGVGLGADLMSLQSKLDNSSFNALIADELTDVVPQSSTDGNSVGGSNEKRGLSPSSSAGQKSTATSRGELTAARPRFLSESYEPNALSDVELMQEAVSIVLWPDSNKTSSTERVRTELMLNAISAQLVKRGLAKELRTNPQLSAAMHILMSSGITSAMGFAVSASLLSAGMTAGFLEGASLYAADHPEKVPALTRLEAQFDAPSNRVMFQIGNTLGIYWGAVLDFVQNIVGLGELAMLLVRYGTPIGQAYGSFKEGIEFIRDPSGYWDKQQDEAQAKREMIMGIFEFLKNLQQDPTLLMEIGEQLGLVAGAESARWFDEDFVEKQSAFDKGMTVGKIEGAILMEIVLLFIGPEVLLAKGASAAGRIAMESQRIEKVVLLIGEALEKVPVLKRLMDIRKLSKAGKLGEVGHAVSEGEKASELSKGMKTGSEAIEKFEKSASPPDMNRMTPEMEKYLSSMNVKQYSEFPVSEAPPMMTSNKGNAAKRGTSAYVPPETPSAEEIKYIEDAKKRPPQDELRAYISDTNGEFSSSSNLGPDAQPKFEIQAGAKKTGSGTTSGIELADTPAKKAKLPKNEKYIRSDTVELAGERGIGSKLNELNAANLSPAELNTFFDFAKGRPIKVQYIARRESFAAARESERAFKTNSSITAIQPKAAAFMKSGYDQGHLAQREAFKYGSDVEKAVDEFTNIVPMSREFNQRGAWKKAEEQTAEWASKYGEVKVEIWPRYDDVNPKVLSDDTPIPEEFVRRVTKMDGTILQDITLKNQ